ncbi:hypothetical protein RSOLAG22IIIB_10309 [Rhizoctonia solani]|uniref:Uncharacterized protein n=1 Tax=Rhizoctonia solani TaxID=456999 RepID=A0A0K6G367_9AGAM|nr:hypothetical protein RSOLAG22IIIB_10309 [Rhizoctonia solani]
MLVARNSNVAQPDIIEWPPAQSEDTNTMGVGHVKTGCSCARAANSFFVTLPDGLVRPLSMFYTCPINFRRFTSPTPALPFSTPATDMLNWPRTQPNLKIEPIPVGDQRAERSKDPSLCQAIGHPSTGWPTVTSACTAAAHLLSPPLPFPLKPHHALGPRVPFLDVDQNGLKKSRLWLGAVRKHNERCAATGFDSRRDIRILQRQQMIYVNTG